MMQRIEDAKLRLPRGAYLHRRPECLALARKRGALARALSSPVPDSVWTALEG